MAISRSKIVSISIVDADTNPSDLASSDIISGEIKSYSQTGGAKEVESDPLFGGFADKEKPREQFEISMEVVPNLTDATSADRWDALAYALHSTGVYVSNADPTDKAVFIEAQDGSIYKSWGFNNCSITLYDLEHNADDNQTGTLTLKFSPETEAGLSNRQSLATNVENLQSWSALTKA